MSLRPRLVSFCAALCLLIILAGASMAAESLFINLTTDDTNRAGMAVFFGHKLLQEGKMPVTIFVNVTGVHLVDKRLPGNRHASGQTIQEMLAGFLRAGGKIYACPMCMQHVGALTAEDLIAGVEIASVDSLVPLMFADGARVMSY